jgi:hypothetical protein
MERLIEIDRFANFLAQKNGSTGDPIPAGVRGSSSEDLHTFISLIETMDNLKFWENNTIDPKAAAGGWKVFAVVSIATECLATGPESSRGPCLLCCGQVPLSIGHQRNPAAPVLHGNKGKGASDARPHSETHFDCLPQVCCVLVTLKRISTDSELIN